MNLNGYMASIEFQLCRRYYPKLDWLPGSAAAVCPCREPWNIQDQLLGPLQTGAWLAAIATLALYALFQDGRLDPCAGDATAAYRS